MTPKAEDSEADDFNGEEPEKERKFVAPLHWHEPKIHPEIVAHGAELARLAVELARIEHSRGKADVSPLDCLQEAGLLLQRAMQIVPANVVISKADKREHDEWITSFFKVPQKFVPWPVICEEGKASDAARKTALKLVINGKKVEYEWKAYVQIEKEGGLRALLFKHAMRVLFEVQDQKYFVRRLERILAVWACRSNRLSMDEEYRKEWWRKRVEKRRRALCRFAASLEGMNSFQIKDLTNARKERFAKRRKMRSIKRLSRHPDLEWSVEFFKVAMQKVSEVSDWPSLEWRRAVVQTWQQTAAQDHAADLLQWAKDGQWTLSRFKAVATTRKLNPPGGRQRGNSGGS